MAIGQNVEDRDICLTLALAKEGGTGIQDLYQQVARFSIPLYLIVFLT